MQMGAQLCPHLHTFTHPNTTSAPTLSP